MTEHSALELATGKQLWALNTRGLLRTALTRSALGAITKATAWQLLADSQREQHRCTGDCYWPRSCPLHGCWRLETAGRLPAYMVPGAQARGRLPVCALDPGAGACDREHDHSDAEHRGDHNPEYPR